MIRTPRLYGAARLLRRRASAPELDFVRKTPRGRWVGWALLATALALAATLAADWTAARDEANQQTDRLERWQAVRPAGGASAVLARSAPATPGLSRAAARQAAARVSQGLRHPWPGIVSAIDEATPAGVQWLRLEHDRTRADVRLAGRAADAKAALSVVDALAVRPGWRSVVLIRVGAVDPAQGNPGVLFEIQAQIDPMALPAGGA
jgi:hypothetical protein